MKVWFYRSENWVKAQRLALGENVTASACADVDVGELSEECRRVILETCDGSYPNSYGAYNRHGNVKFDGDTPTAAEISAAILQAAVDRVAAQAAEVAKKKAEHEARIARAQRWAARPLAERVSAAGILRCGETPDGPLATSGRVQYPLEELAEHVPAAYAEADREWERLKAIARAEQAVADRKILAEFLQAVPQDALRGTLRAIATDAKAIDALRKRVEDASPIAIFEDDEDDDADDN